MLETYVTKSPKFVMTALPTFQYQHLMQTLEIPDHSTLRGYNFARCEPKHHTALGKAIKASHDHAHNQAGAVLYKLRNGQESQGNEPLCQRQNSIASRKTI